MDLAAILVPIVVRRTGLDAGSLAADRRTEIERELNEARGWDPLRLQANHRIRVTVGVSEGKLALCATPTPSFIRQNLFLVGFATVMALVYLGGGLVAGVLLPALWLVAYQLGFRVQAWFWLGRAQRVVEGRSAQFR